MDFTEHMTDEMLSVNTDTAEIIERVTTDLIVLAMRAAKAGAVALPMTNERGTAVLHGCRRRMICIDQTCMGAARMLLDLMPVDSIDAVRQRVKEMDLS